MADIAACGPSPNVPSIWIPLAVYVGNVLVKEGLFPLTPELGRCARRSKGHYSDKRDDKTADNGGLGASVELTKAIGGRKTPVSTTPTASKFNMALQDRDCLSVFTPS